MGCSHATGCPLFPLLRESLRGWRDYYCDSNDQWLGCARYKMSMTGERVPISLLPNGAQARHLEDAADTGGTCAPAAGHAAPQTAVRQEPWSPQGSYATQPPQGAYATQQPQGSYAAQPPQGAYATQPPPVAQPVRPAAPSGHRVAAPESVTPWATGAPAMPITLGTPAPPPYASQEHARPAPSAQRTRQPQAPRAKRGLWARLTDWMSRPA